MRSHSYLNTAKKIVQSYDGSIPLASWLKQFFRTDKKFGSKDRKEISHAVYCFYRLGNSFGNEETEERILKSLFLCSQSSNKILEELRPALNENINLPLEEKIERLSASGELKNIFPFVNLLSNQIEEELFYLSFLVQPHFYLRLRPGKKQQVTQQLITAEIKFEIVSDNCIQLFNQTRVEEVIRIDEDAVVQDLNSQKVLALLSSSKLQTPNSKLSVWDCCAASGGKSILFHDCFPNAHVTVSDVRESILINLKKRFSRAGIKQYEYFIADLSSPQFSISQTFDVVICDAPCSGSGTWSRTPEQLYFFKAQKIEHYARLQKKIALNAVKAVKKDGYFLYITCSVFAKENEELVEFILNDTSLQLIATHYFKGYDKRADTLFVAVFSL